MESSRRLWLTAAFCVVAAAAGISTFLGCRQEKLDGPAAGRNDGLHFLDLADDQEKKIESRESALFGIVTVTKVQPASYDRYLEEKKAGRVTAEVLRDGFTYFAVTDDRCCPFPNGVSAWVTITERYKAPCPK
jgi:hypothetical protein